MRCPRILDSSSSSHLAIHMSIVGNAFKLSNRPSIISCHDTRLYDSSRVDGTIDYPSCQTILSCILAEHGEGDSLEDCYHHDALLRFTILGHFDLMAHSNRIAKDPILLRILNIGLYNWSTPDRQGGSVTNSEFTHQVCQTLF